MIITFENEDDVIVYALEKIISFARNNQYIFLAQRVWWISSILGLQQNLVIHIDNLKKQLNINTPVHLNRVAPVETSDKDRIENPDRIEAEQVLGLVSY
jgi:hypothetical protein